MPPSNRYSAVDALRGLIMMFMAIDHVNAYVSRQHGSEFWNGAVTVYSSSFAFLTRLITHLCAPGFFFLMGAGIYWFATSRRDSGWTASQVTRRTAWRGFAILLTGQFLENPILFTTFFLAPPAVALSHLTLAPPNDATQPFWGFITLSGLGAVMIVCAFLLRLPPWTWFVVSAASVLATHTLLPSDGHTGPLWASVLLAPGISQHVLVMYPVIPWLAVATFGMYFGYLWKSRPALQSNVWILGLALIAVAVTVRALAGPGNLVLPRDASWIEFFNNVKYPPSLVFWTLSVGVDLVILAALMRLPAAIRSVNSPFVVYGQAPLLFYVAHFYVLAAIGFTFFRTAAPLEMTYAIWLVILVIFYPICRAYRTFKLAKPAESLWRLF